MKKYRVITDNLEWYESWQDWVEEWLKTKEK